MELHNVILEHPEIAEELCMEVLKKRDFAI